MFNQIETINNKWVGEQLELLSEVELLLFYIDVDYAQSMKNFRKKLSILHSTQIDAFCKDPVFHNWLNAIKSDVIRSIETGHKIPRHSSLETILFLLNLSVVVLLKEYCAFELRFLLPRKILLPVSGFFLDFPNEIKEREKTKCQYLPEINELEIDGKRHRLLSYAQFESIKIVDRNFDFFTDPAGDKYAISLDANIDLLEWLNTLELAMALVKKDPTSHQLVSKFVSYLVPLKQHDDTLNLSFSVRNLPNVIFKNNELTPYLIGETLIHEADHQLFYIIEKAKSFWINDVRLQEPVYYSPWRDDPRPLDGILRGLSAFVRVSHYYSVILNDSIFTSEQMEAVGIMLLTRIYQSETALQTIIQSQQLSESGLSYVNQVQQTLSEVNARTKSQQHCKSWRSYAEEQVATHRRNWEELNNRYA